MSSSSSATVLVSVLSSSDTWNTNMRRTDLSMLLKQKYQKEHCLHLFCAIEGSTSITSACVSVFLASSTQVGLVSTDHDNHDDHDNRDDKDEYVHWLSISAVNEA